MSFSIMGQFIATVILLEAAPTAFQTIGYGFWILLICLTAIYGLLVYFFLPEVRTRRRTRQQVNLADNCVDERHDSGRHQRALWRSCRAQL
jgi:hypothetical protein